MKILVGACLLGENCKYSGGNNYNQAVCDFVRGHQVIPVCPEVLGGLPTPRCPAEIVQSVFARMLMDEGVNVLDAALIRTPGMRWHVPCTKNTVIRKVELSRRCSMALRASNWCFWRNILGNEDGKSAEPYPRPEDVLQEFLKQNWILNARVQDLK